MYLELLRIINSNSLNVIKLWREQVCFFLNWVTLKNVQGVDRDKMFSSGLLRSAIYSHLLSIGRQVQTIFDQ